MTSYRIVFDDSTWILQWKFDTIFSVPFEMQKNFLFDPDNLIISWKMDLAAVLAFGLESDYKRSTMLASDNNPL